VAEEVRDYAAEVREYNHGMTMQQFPKPGSLINGHYTPIDPTSEHPDRDDLSFLIGCIHELSHAVTLADPRNVLQANQLAKHIKQKLEERYPVL
jgi:hypothetical protein